MRQDLRFPEPVQGLKCELAAELLWTTGRLRLKVEGFSMFPAIRPGDVLTVERVDPRRTREGEVVVCGCGTSLRVHRLAGKLGDGGRMAFVTRGDSLVRDDPPVPPEQVLGRVTTVERGQLKFTCQGKPPLWNRLVSGLCSRSTRLTGIMLRVCRPAGNEKAA
jgi:signal peptidase I